MEVKISIDARSLNSIKEKFPDIVRKSLVDAFVVLHQASLRELSKKVYAIPETEILRRNRKTKRVRKEKMWKRTSDLYRAEAAGADYSHLNEFRVILGNNSPYAWRRHQLKYPAKTGYRTLDGRGKNARMVTKQRPDRTAHWREDALKKEKQRVADIFENGVQAGINAL